MVDTVWRDVRQQLRERLRAWDYDTWIAPLEATTWSSGELTLEVPSAFFLDWLKAHHVAIIEEALFAVTGTTGRVRLVENRALSAPRERRPLVRAGAATLPPAVVATNGHGPRGEPPPLGTFESFVVGDSNRVAYEAALAIVERPGARYNPLFLYGVVGIGKTHLLSAIAHALAVRGGRGTVASLSAENFVNEMISAITRRQMERFRQRFRGIGTLIVDDIQFLADKQRSQEEFTHTFNALHDGRKQIVVASDRAPRDLPGFGDTLRNRFAAGLLADIRSPDPELRLALVRRKAADRGLPVDDAVVRFLAERWCENGRELEGALLRVEAHAGMGHRAITLGLVREALAAPGHGKQRRPSLDRIVAEVCRHYQLSRAELVSPSRANRVAQPRQLAMYLCRRHTDESLEAIGAELGREHSTVVHALGAIEQRLARDAALRDVLIRLESRLAT